MKITSQEKNRLVVAWFWVCLWDGLFGFGGIMAWRANASLGAKAQPLDAHDLFLLFFPAVGLAFLVWAIRQTVLWSTYGLTYFVSDVEIVPWAGKLDGRILFSRPLPASMGRSFKLSLICLYDQGSGKSRETAIVWQDSHVADISADAIPVSFSLPSETKPNPLLMSSPMLLRLQVKEAEGGFRSFAAEYHLPFEGSPNDDPFAQRKRDFARRQPKS
jgi:hypothetical protein